MKQKILRFDSLKNITPKGFDGIAIRYPFAMVDSQSVGLPEERQKTSQHSLEVSVSDTKLEAWKLDDHDLVKVLFEIGKRALEQKLGEGDISDMERVTVTTATHPGECPFVPERIDDPNGAVIEINILSRIGFTAARTARR